MTEIKAYIITIGDEILIGQVSDTNAPYLSKSLTKLGISVVGKASIPDEPNALIKQLDFAKQSADLVLITGGLGPTKDDKTKQTIAQYFDDELVLDQASLDKTTALITALGSKMNSLNVRQAYRPSKATLLYNTIGTADGILMNQQDTWFVFMPGVPFEMKHVFGNALMPWIYKQFQLPVWVHRTVMVKNIPESALAIRIEPWEDALPNHIRLAYLPAGSMVRLRLSAFGNSKIDLEQSIETLLLELKGLLGDSLNLNFSDNAIQSLQNLFISKGWSLSTAESCTGGYIASQITALSGSSAYFKGSVVAYDASVKSSILGLTSEDMSEGLVSESVALKMAMGVQRQLKSDVTIATTGAAGPLPSPVDKVPVGTVCVAIVAADYQWTKTLFFPHFDREDIVKRTTNVLINNLLLLT